MRRHARAAFLAALVTLGCEATDEPRAADAEATVREMFAAADAGDCATLRRLIQGMDSDDACHEYLHGWRENGISLVGITRISRDGRDPNAFLVHSRVSRHGEVREGITRAVHDENGRWTVVVR